MAPNLYSYGLPKTQLARYSLLYTTVIANCFPLKEMYGPFTLPYYFLLPKLENLLSNLLKHVLVN